MVALAETSKGGVGRSANRTVHVSPATTPVMAGTANLHFRPAPHPQGQHGIRNQVHLRLAEPFLGEPALRRYGPT